MSTPENGGDPTASDGATGDEFTGQEHIVEPNDTGPTVPVGEYDDGVMAAALAYADAGLYIGPWRVLPGGQKHAGSVLGAGWPTKTSRDVRTITDWYAGTSGCGVFLHCGRSGVVGFDGDDLEAGADTVAALEAVGAPCFSTRRDGSRRTYLVRTPARRTVGNASEFDGFDVRGNNGVVMLPPSDHPNPAGEYRWLRTGAIPHCPPELAERLTDGADGETSATPTVVSAWWAAHPDEVPDVDADQAARLKARLERWRHEAATGSRHDALKAVLPFVCRVVQVGQAGTAVLAAMRHEHEAMLADERHPNGVARRPGDWSGLLAWAVAQASAHPDLAETNADWLAGLGSTGATGDAGATGDKHPPVTLAEAEATFHRWMGAEYDLDALRASLAVVAAERLNGDPPWLLILSGSGNAKTETVTAAEGAGALVTSSLSGESALLSGSPAKDRKRGATGGLLRELGDRGVLVIKDVTTILSMHREARATTLAALREVADGRWTRTMGTDGGRTYSWAGRVVTLGAVTSAWDNAHSVVAAMGDRFLVCRIDSTRGRSAAGRQALANIGHEVDMRADLRAAFGGVIAQMSDAVDALTDHEVDVLLGAADLVTTVRTNVERDARDGTVVSADLPEAPTRFLKQLGQVLRGGVAVGMERSEALRLALRLALDSMPPQRRDVLRYFARPGVPPSNVTEVRKAVRVPHRSADRALRELDALRVLDFHDDTDDDAVGKAMRGRFVPNGTYCVADGFQAAVRAVLGQ